MGKTLAKNMLAMPETRSGKNQFRIELQEILATQILEFAAFEQIPDPFLWIEFGCISRQTLQVNTLSPTRSQELFDGLTVMNRGTIPDDEQLP